MNIPKNILKKRALVMVGLCCIFLLLILAGCTQSRVDDVIEMDVLDSGSVVFELEGGEKDWPLRFSGPGTSGSSSIYFETETEKHWISGNPIKMENSAEKFLGVWNVGNREVSIEFERMDNGYHFNLSAKPSEGIKKWGFGLAASSDEFFTGLMERVVDGNQEKSWAPGLDVAMNLRGQTVEMLIKPTLGLYTPFYLSSKGYGLFIEGTWPGHYDFCKDNPNLMQVAFEGPDMKGMIYTSNKPSEIVQAHSLNVGPTIVPPRWAFEPIRWRDNHHIRDAYYDGTTAKSPFNAMLTEDVLMMEAFDIPMGGYWIDRPWGKTTDSTMRSWEQGYEDFDWDFVRLPKADKMPGWLASKDINLLLWMAPWITGEWREEAVARNYTIPHKEWAGNKIAMIDFSNPEAVEWWQENGPAKVLRDGVKGFKLDRAEEFVLDDGDFEYANGKSAREMRNAYPVHYAKAAHDISKKIHGDDFLIFPRAGYTGTSRYAAVWGGDTGAGWEIVNEEGALRCAIVQLMRSSIIGFPIFGTDIGGYWAGTMRTIIDHSQDAEKSKEKRKMGTDREVLARWLALGAFNPLMEMGPIDDRAPWDMVLEPHYDTELIAVTRLYTKVHSALAPHSHQLAQEAHETGMPIARPLFLEYPEQTQSWEDWQTFTYGPDLLVSAIWKKGKKNHEVYLPAGEKWVDAWDRSKVYEGGKKVSMDTPFHKIPIFIREGATVDLGDLNKLYQESLDLASKKPNLRRLEKTIDY